MEVEKLHHGQWSDIVSTGSRQQIETNGMASMLLYLSVSHTHRRLAVIPADNDFGLKSGERRAAAVERKAVESTDRVD